MRRADRRRWRSARTLADLGQLTAEWLTGELASQPGYQPDCGPDSETVPLVPVLAALNRAGMVTDCSQPGVPPEADDWGEVWVQRAAVSLYVDRPGLRRLASLIWSTPADRLLVISHTVSTRGCRNGVPVTLRDGREFTGFGRQLTRRILSDRWDTLGDTAFRAVCDAWQITLVDPEWGRDNVLWPALADLVNATTSAESGGRQA